MTKRQIFQKNLIKNPQSLEAVYIYIVLLIDKEKNRKNKFVKKTTFYRCRGHPDTS